MRHDVIDLDTGLIPARAGKTRRRGGASRRRRAHPRACGENAPGPLLGRPGGGSSPRVRGKLVCSSVRYRVSRLIPARAGKTSGASTPASGLEAHPRACGENTSLVSCLATPGGSSPRVRGKPYPTGNAGASGRLIPARAGKTVRHESKITPPTAHPRACGENCPLALPCTSATGSSPRVRGKRHRMVSLVWLHGLIPARAGKTAPP